VRVRAPDGIRPVRPSGVQEPRTDPAGGREVGAGLQGKEVPGELLKKIKGETRLSEEMAAEMEMSEREIRQLKEMRRQAPKDGKGNPILPEPKFPECAPRPYEYAGEVGDREYAESFFPRSFT
jgi:hypothetical protein